jgi:hypothetical protein
VLLRTRALRGFEALIVGLFGFTVAESTFGGPIGHLIGSFFHALGHL